LTENPCVVFSANCKYGFMNDSKEIPKEFPTQPFTFHPHYSPFTDLIKGLRAAPVLI